jgi:hypothetical protein
VLALAYAAFGVAWLGLAAEIARLCLDTSPAQLDWAEALHDVGFAAGTAMLIYIFLWHKRHRVGTGGNFLRNAVDSMSDGFVIFDRNDKLVAINDKCKRLHRLPQHPPHSRGNLPAAGSLTAVNSGPHLLACPAAAPR